MGPKSVIEITRLRKRSRFIPLTNLANMDWAPPQIQIGYKVSNFNHKTTPAGCGGGELRVDSRLYISRECEASSLSDLSMIANAWKDFLGTQPH